MLHLPNYVITEQIGGGLIVDVFKGYAKEQGKKPCLIKHFHFPTPSVSNITRIKQTYKTLQKLSAPGILKVYEVLEQADGLVLVFEDTPILTLKSFLETGRVSMDLFFQIGVALTATLQEAHHHHVIHGSIKPSNILIHPDTYQPKLWDFGIFPLLQPSITFFEPNFSRISLPYISPEQSGRLHRTADYRTDLYSLGITFYEMLAGYPPFFSTDPLEIIHSHLARNPKPLSAVTPDIPQTVSDIVLKLLAKEPESRYQSGRGVQLDLENCQRQFSKAGTIPSFKLGQYDQTDKFLISQRLYGRDDEIELLRQAVHSIEQGGTEFVLVTGEAGIGKSALVQEVNALVVQGDGYFIAGKYEQLLRNKAYNGILQAVRDLIQQITHESEDQLAEWKKRLSLALGQNMTILYDLVPEVSQILEFPTRPEPSAPMNSNQLNLVFEQFLQVFAAMHRPLVIFLDDLQWADAASFDLIRHILLAPATGRTLLIAAYREKEIESPHPLLALIHDLETAGISIQSVKLASLTAEIVNQWLSDSFSLAPEITLPFSVMIRQKTYGCPFFIKLFLQTLYEESILEFDNEAGWRWDLSQGQQLEVTSNVVNLMVARISSLPEITQSVLTLAACVGNTFSLDTLASILSDSQEKTYLNLEPAIIAGMVLQTDQRAFRFAHDRIQQAVYSLLETEQKQQIHRQIGLYWLAQQTRNKDDNIFDVVNQMNLGQTSDMSEADCLQLLALNVEAGQKAKKSAAYQTAYEYLDTALALSRRCPEGWDNHHDLWLDLFDEAIETAYLSGHLEEMEQNIPVLLDHARTILEKQRTSHIRIQACLSKNQLPEAFAIGREVLAALGIILPEEPTQADFETGYARIERLLDGRDIDTLIDLPPMQDPNSMMAMRILAAISTAVWAMSPILYALDVFKRVELSLAHGNAPTSAAAYAGFGVILCGQIGDVAMGHHFGQLALEIVEKYQLKATKPRTIGTAYCFTFHWQKHLRDSLAPFYEGYQEGIDVGDFSFASSNAYVYVRHALFSGQNLATLNHRIHTLAHRVRQLKQDRAVFMLDMYLQVCIHLQQETAQPSHLVGSAFNEDKILPIYQASHDNNRISTLLCNKFILAYLFADYEEALRLAYEVEKRVDGLSASIYLPLFNFYDSLTHLALFAGRSAEEQTTIWKHIESNQKKLQYWAENAPMNFQHKWLMVAAEQAVIVRDFGQAREYYDEAIRLAGVHGYIQEEGLANELASRFYLNRGQEGLARYYLQAAMDCYGRWGAVAKQKQIKRTHPQLFSQDSSKSVNLENQITDTAVENVLEYATVLKATRIISEEIVLAKLLEKLMRIVIENAGAQSGFLILPRDGILKIEAAVTTDAEDVNLFMSQPVDGCRSVAVSVVHHVAQTGETVLLHHAAREGAFTNDPNILAHQTKSVLCMMIRRQQEVIGILYLENNLTTHAFTEARIELLQILLSQAAISLQNAIYYENLKQEIEERKSAEARLRASEAEWRSVVDNAPDTIIIITRDLRIRFINRLVSSLRREDVLGQLVTDFVMPEERSVVREHVEYVFTHGTHTEYESSGPDEHGKVGWYSSRLGPILHEGEVIGVMMVATNITQRRETEDKLHLYMAELERSNRELQEFAYVSSHDLQEPLRKIQTFGDRLTDKYNDVLDERGLDYLMRMQNAAARMQALIQDLLAFSRVTTKAHPFEKIELNKVVQDALLNLELQIEQTKGQVHVARLHQIEADESQMLQLFQNLISNALKFHHSDIPPVIQVTDELMIDRQLEFPFVRITVEDNGIGFEEQYAERIFGVFQRLHGRDRYDGTGVGLAICRKITDRHHGQISAVSQPGKGTKIIVLLPQSQKGLPDGQGASGTQIQDTP